MSTFIKELRDSIPRLDALDKITGKTKYLQDIDFGDDVLHAVTVRSTKARAKLIKINVPQLPDGYYTIDASDVPGNKEMQMIIADWPPFAYDIVRFIGEAILLVVGPCKNKVYEIADQITIDYEEMTPAFTMEDSEKLVGGAVHGDDNIFVSFKAGYGDTDNAFKNAKQILEETYYTPHQEHLYMETVGAIARIENDKVAIYSSTQCPFYVRHSVAPVLGYEDDDLKIVAPPIGGGFGGKEHYSDVVASTVAVACHKLKKTIKCVLDRQEDIAFTVKRQPAKINIKVALDESNNITAVDIKADMDAGAYEACSRVIMQRCTYTAAGVYNFPTVKIFGRAFATNKPPSCAFRGFGAPQAIFAIERMMDKVANHIGMDQVLLRKKYLIKQGDTTVTGGKYHDNIILDKLLDKALEKIDYDKKTKEYGRGKYRGVGISCFIHGCAFTGSGERDIIKSKVRLLKENNKVTIFTSNTEIGQGLYTTFIKIVAKELGIPIEDIDIHEYDTTKICNSGPTIASRSIMIVGYLLEGAAREMKSRWNEGDRVEVLGNYKHPDHLIPWDTKEFKGDAYPSFGIGVNAVEVEIDKTTFEIEIKDVWGVFDCGYPIDDLIVEGQIKGGMMQALGWAFLEKLEERDGKFLQIKMSDYMIPTSLDVGTINALTINEPYEYGPSGAKGLGEITFDGAAAALATAVDNALNHHFNRIPILPENIAEVL